MTLNASNGSNLEQLALKALMTTLITVMMKTNANHITCTTGELVCTQIQSTCQSR